MSQNKFLLKWENGTTKHSFGPSSKLPLRLHDRVKLAESMTFEQIIDTGEFVEDDDARRKFKWKAMRDFYSVTLQDRYKHCNMEKALWVHAGTKVTSHHFVAALMAEYDFELSMYYDRRLRNLYFSFEGGKHDNADWRDILATYRVLVHFRHIKESPLELILLLFDIYTTGDKDGKSVKKEKYVLTNATEYIHRIFRVPCITGAEIGVMDSKLVDLFHILKVEKQTITRLAFQRLLESEEHNHLVKLWAKYAWERLPTELKLTAYDEAQLRHRDNAEALLMRHKLSQAIMMYNKTILRVVYREWKLEMLREAGVRNFIHRVLYRKRNRFFKFWDKLTSRLRIKRRKRYLAEVIGNYSLKARSFARIKLFIYNAERVHRIVGTFDRKGRLQKLGGYHLREYRRKSWLKKYYHRWWNKCVDMINHALSLQHDRHRIMSKALMPWYRYAHEKELARRNEEVIRENKLKFDRMMEEADIAAKELMDLENARNEKAKREAEEARRMDREKRLKDAQERTAKAKAEEKKLLLSVQKEERQRRVDKAMRTIKSDFKKEWEEKTEVVLAKAKSRITAYIENKDNKLAIEMKFEQLKREFFQPPTPENAERERVLSSLKNIVFLYLQAKLRADLIKLSDLLPKFDKGKKGYLTYSEFKEMIKSIGADINPAKISAIIRGVDVDGDKCIELKELEMSMKETEQMGVMGSAWRWYIDPAENVMTYHNFVTGERIFDYQMTDKKLRQINIENMYGEADHLAVIEVQEMKVQEWDLRIKNHMASRLQYLYRRRKANNWRKKRMFKLSNAILKAKADLQRHCVRFMERSWIGYKSRFLFRKQLRYAYEKIWDLDSGKIFWYNGITGQSSWDRPAMLGRYEDVTDPPEWVSSPVIATEADFAAHRQTLSGSTLAATSCDGVQFDPMQLYVIHYWHVKARKSIPRKPDGLPVCVHCCRNIASHHCTTCNMEYCLACHRGTHGNPFGFHQFAKATKEQYSDPAFLQQLSFHQHPFTLSEPKRCQMCKSTKVCAGIHCDTCEVDMCRACSRRIHEHASKQGHPYYSI